MGAIYALWIRQLKKYWRSKSRIVGSLGQPLLFLVALGFGLGPTYQQANGGSYIDFLAPGIIAMSVLFTAMFAGIEVIWDRQFGFLKETLVAPISRFKIMVGRTLGGATVASIQGLVVFIITLFIGFRPSNWLYLPIAFIFMFLIALLFTSFGTLVAIRMEDMQAFPLIMNFVVMPIFFLSGSLFPLNNLPGPLKIITRINPLSYGIDGIRFGLTGISNFGLLLDLIVLSGLFLLTLLFGAYLFKNVEA
jgi:ABC-2 type transport system permease protein